MIPSNRTWTRVVPLQERHRWHRVQAQRFGGIGVAETSRLRHRSGRRRQKLGTEKYGHYF